ncbi:MAG: hypothetical protein ACRDK2_16645 [Solirubrobacteraceae bacterium]
MSTTVPRLPGEELLHTGLEDLRAGRESEAALVVQIASPRLRALGFEVPESRSATCEGELGSPEHRLYALLVREWGRGAHSRYNALLARIASFARAAAHAPTG